MLNCYVIMHMSIVIRHILRTVFVSLLICLLMLPVAGNAAGGNKEYDYIIVGGGTAGCVLASRLSKIKQNTILVLEAGPSEKEYPDINVPFNAPILQGTYIDWMFKSETQKYAGQACENKKMLLPQGKILGGSGSHNFLNYIRGSRHDFDFWNDLGNEGWSYEDVLPYFIKSENMRDETLANSEYHGVGGPLDLEKPDIVSNLRECLLQGAEEMGFKRADVNGEDSLAFSLITHNTRYGRRMDPATAFLRPAMAQNKNIDVITEAFVTKVLLENKEATGVKYIKNGQEFEVKAKKEVIVSAGSLMSPKILMLSGIGPRDHLESLGIDVVADLPVGSYLEDHIGLLHSYTINASISMKLEDILSFESKFNYNIYGTGDLSSSGVLINGFIRTSTSPEYPYYPNLQWLMVPFPPGYSPGSSTAYRSFYGFNSSYWDNFHLHERGKPGFTMVSVLLHPHTTGTVRLRSNNPYNQAIYSYDYLDNDYDVNDMLESIRLQQQFVKTEALRSIGTVYESPHHAGCLEHTYDSDEYWKCLIYHNTLSFYHYASTCKMANDSTGVVDNQLRVKGINKLRVVDASVMPHVTSGNIMAPTIMIAEKAADIIIK